MRTVSSSNLFVISSKLTYGKELARSSSIFTASFARIYLLVCVQVVMVYMLRVVLPMFSASVRIDTTVGDEVPASLRLVSKEHVGSVVPA